jgi:transcriptional regulator with XRE-family HTH domain
MSENVTEALGANIKALREERGMSQQQLAESIYVQRPTVSIWENGKSEPSTTQLVKLAKALNVSLDVLVGNAHESKRVIVLDTSVLMKRPAIIDELIAKFDKVLVPDVVVSELNGIKDGNNRHKQRTWFRNKQRAWFAMANLEKKIADGTVECVTSPQKDEISDEKIFAVAIKRARESLGDRVYMFSDDIYFSYLAKRENLPNLENLTFPLYAERFPTETDTDRDQVRSQGFYSLVRNQKLDEVKSFNMQGVDVNLVDAESGWTPLIHAVHNLQYEMVAYLIDIPGIDINKPDGKQYRFTPLHHAAQIKSGALEIFKLLVNKGADYEKGTEGKNIKNKGNTPLMVSAWGGFQEGVEYLLQQGVCVNQQDSNGFTALIKACKRGYFDIGLLLVPLTDVAIRSYENQRAEDYIDKEKLNAPKAKRLIEEIINKRNGRNERKSTE